MTPVTEWIDSKAIQGIAGALKPSAYVARAYKYTRQNNGAFPEWTKKTDNEHWLFSLEYIKADAKINLPEHSYRKDALSIQPEFHGLPAHSKCHGSRQQ